MRRYPLTSNAEHDIDLIKDYLLAQGGYRLVRHVLTRIQEGMHLLGRMPGIGHLRVDTH